MTSIAFFDFDGTITKDDSLFKFIRFVVGDLRFVYGLMAMSPMLILYKFKIIPNYTAKEMLFSYYFKGMSEDIFLKLANQYSLSQIDTIVRKKALEKLNWHKSQHHKVVVVSASLDYWLRPWCEKNDLELLATKLEIINGIVTGKLLGKNCYGIEKVNRIKEIYDLESYEYIYAYGDSKGDIEILKLAHKGFYKPFM